MVVNRYAPKLFKTKNKLFLWYHLWVIMLLINSFCIVTLELLRCDAMQYKSMKTFSSIFGRPCYRMLVGNTLHVIPAVRHVAIMSLNIITVDEFGQWPTNHLTVSRNYRSKISCKTSQNYVPFLMKFS